MLGFSKYSYAISYKYYDKTVDGQSGLLENLSRIYEIIRQAYYYLRPSDELANAVFAYALKNPEMIFVIVDEHHIHLHFINDYLVELRLSGIEYEIKGNNIVAPKNV